MSRLNSDVDALDRDVMAAIKFLRDELAPADGSPADIHIASLETFAVIALRVFRKTNPSKLRSEARTVEIKARMDGVPVMTTQGELT